MNRQEKIDAIYEKIARKDLSFGCFMKDKNNKKIVKYVGVKVYGPNNKYDSIWDGYRIEKNLSRKMNDLENYEIIGHPVMIGDVMDYIEINFPDGIHCIECKKGEVVSDDFNDDTFFYCNNKDCEFTSKFYGDEVFCNKMELYDGYWKEKRKPIEAQSDECVDFVFDLIS